MFILNTIPKKMEENEKKTTTQGQTNTTGKDKCSIEVGCKMLCSEKLPLWKISKST